MQLWIELVSANTSIFLGVVNAITTIALVIITFIYVKITHRIQKDQYEKFQIETRPFLTYRDFIIEPSWENSKLKAIRLGIRLKNISPVLVRYKVKKGLISVGDINIKQGIFT